MQTFNIITLIFVLFALASADQSNVRRQLKATKDPAATNAAKATKDPAATKAPKGTAVSTKAPTVAASPPTSGAIGMKSSFSIASALAALLWLV